MTTQKNREVNTAFFDLVEVLKDAKKALEKYQCDFDKDIIARLGSHIEQLSEPCILPGEKNA